jgi:hypothetical protein
MHLLIGLLFQLIFALLVGIITLINFHTFINLVDVIADKRVEKGFEAKKKK